MAGSDWGTLGEPTVEGSAELLKVFEADAGTLRHAYFHAGAEVAYHEHDSASIVYGIGGPCVELPGGVIKRRLTYHPAGHGHSLSFQGATHMAVLEIERASFRECPAAYPDISVALPATLYDQVWRLLIAIADDTLASQIDRTFTELLEMVQAQGLLHLPKWLADVIDNLHVHWRDVPSAHRIALRYDISAEYLCRAFKRYTGVTLQDYSLRLRLDYARGLLWGSGIPLATVAAETGFSDQSHLTRALGAHSDQTPLRLRNSAPCRVRLPSVRVLTGAQEPEFFQ